MGKDEALVLVVVFHKQSAKRRGGHHHPRWETPESMTSLQTGLSLVVNTGPPVASSCDTLTHPSWWDTTIVLTDFCVGHTHMLLRPRGTSSVSCWWILNRLFATSTTIMGVMIGMTLEGFAVLQPVDELQSHPS